MFLIAVASIQTKADPRLYTTRNVMISWRTRDQVPGQYEAFLISQAFSSHVHGLLSFLQTLKYKSESKAFKLNHKFDRIV